MPRQHVQANASQWSYGKVHYARNFDPRDASSGLTLCGRTVYGTVVEAEANPVSCKHCIRQNQPG